MKRRNFVQAVAAAGIANSVAGLCSANEKGGSANEKKTAKDGNKVEHKSKPKLAVFTKSFQTWDIPTVCKKFKSLGLDGLDLTVRKGGHILPENVRKELPAAAKAAKENGVEIVQITSGIVEADSDAEMLFQTAGELGIRKIKLGYFRSKELGMLKKNIGETKKTLERISRLAARYQVMPCVHIHSSVYIPSHGTMLYELIKDFPTDRIGAYVDALHMVLEGGRGGWIQGLDLLAPWTQLCAIKNFDYVKEGRNKQGQQVWKTRTIAVADGISPIPDFVGTLKKLGYRGPYSLHSEYKGRHSFKEMDTDGCYEQTAKDLEFFRTLL